MGLDSNLISQFVKATKDEKNTKTETTVYGKVVSVGDKTYVKLDGSDQLTPVSTTTAVKEDERVSVMIKDHSATITGNVSSPAARTDDVNEIGKNVSEFEIILADKVSTEQLEVEVARIEILESDNVKINKELQAANIKVDNLDAKVAEIDEAIIEEAEIENLIVTTVDAKVAEMDFATVEQLDATNAIINNLDSTYATIEKLEATDAEIDKLKSEQLTVKELEGTFANIDFANINEAAIENFFTKSGMIDNLVVSEGTITGKLVGVTISGDLIEGNTVKADKLVVKGEDGLYYKLNFEAGSFTDAEEVPTDSLHGSIITANSITAEKISVKDLVAFGATIGGFKISDHSIYSGVKSSADNTTRGLYMDDEGQMSFGDSINFLRYYKDQNGDYKLEISASSIKLGTSSKSVEEIAKDAEEAVDKVASLEERANSGEFKGEDAVLLRIESSRGTVFKNDMVATVLSVVIYQGPNRITDNNTLKATFGNNAYLQWKWQRLDDETFGIISSSDSRFGDSGFTFTLSPKDVDTKVTFMCELII